MTSLLAAQVVARRVFSSLYIYLDIAFLVLLCALLFFKKRHLTLLFGLAGGVLYMLVDYGIFHLLTGSRHIEGGSLFWVLLWMSMSYGITNFVLLWVWMGKDRRAVEWTLLISVWWIAAPLIAASFGQTFPTVTIWRETEGYHGYMALVLLAGYLFGILYNLRRREREKRLPLLRLFMLGVAVQLAWELALLIGGIRSDGFSWEQKLNTLVVNSLLETNLGAVPIFCIYALVTARFSESGARRPGVAFSERVKEINLRSFRGMPDEPVPVQNPAPQPAAAAPVTVPVTVPVAAPPDATAAAPAERPPVRP